MGTWWKAGLLLAAVTAAGCTENPKFEAARRSAAATFAYPSSAKFRNVRAGRSGLVCGEVNGRDLDGRETGFRRFSWLEGGTAQVEGDSHRTGDEARDLDMARVQDMLVNIGCD